MDRKRKATRMSRTNRQRRARVAARPAADRSAIQLPKFVDVCGHRVRIVRRNESKDPGLKNAWGYFTREDAIIVIDEGCGQEMATAVLHHELAHAFLHYGGTLFQLTGLLNIKDPELLGFVEETIIRTAMVPHSMTCARQAAPI